jgi:hypothetical protein
MLVLSYRYVANSIVQGLFIAAVTHDPLPEERKWVADRQVEIQRRVPVDVSFPRIYQAHFLSSGFT